MTVSPVVELTVRWLERAVIGLNLCPFAKSVHTKGQIHYAVTTANTSADLLEVLQSELKALLAEESSVRDTTLLIAPEAFPDFWDFNRFLPECDRLLRRMGLEGVFQIASFHPEFQFADTQPDDITNATNRAPYPTLHLLRESSIDRAVAAFLEPDAIFEKNMQTLKDLGASGWHALGLQVTAVAGTTPSHGTTGP